MTGGDKVFLSLAIALAVAVVVWVLLAWGFVFNRESGTPRWNERPTRQGQASTHL